MTYNIQLEEERDFEVASDADMDRHEADMHGQYNTDQEWILSDRDVWYRNPSFVGTPGRHPEDDYDYDEADAAGSERLVDAREAFDDDDIPF